MTSAQSSSSSPRRPVHTRPVTAHDLPVVLQMLQDLADFEGVSARFHSTLESLQAAMFGPQPILFGSIALVADAPAGVILGYETYGTFAAAKRLFIEDLYVRAEHRGGGVGRALIAAFAQRAIDRGYGGLHWRVLDANDSGIRFYRAIGAEVSSEHRNCSLAGPALRVLVDATAAIRERRVLT
jgi:GNAT superfamily N-acetyltransferase